MKHSLPPPAVVVVADPASGDLHYATGRKQQVFVGARALATMQRHRQLRERDSEAGGMLFARISPEAIRIEDATEPQRSDWRWRFGFWPCNRTQQQVIDAKFKIGLHFVGEWHTHPEPRPHPSALDFDSMEKCFLHSRHQLKAIIMIILGTSPAPEGLWVSLHNQKGNRRLKISRR
jgi:integrative and conjugative element protein (TIGR02256 family)